jgi:hypothetical protein
MLHYLDDMDSKMECMRSLIESDRQVEGCFTAYNTALERSVLKKDLFLSPPEPSPETSPKTSKDPLRKELPVTPATEAPPAPPVNNGGPKPESPFADKLRQALQPAGTSEGS